MRIILEGQTKWLRKKHLFFIFVAASFIIYANISSLPTKAAPVMEVSAQKTYYVSKSGNNQGGTSWQTAWNEMNQIQWSIIAPGDTILLDGGNNGMTYSTALEIGRSGSSGNPIKIWVATENSRNGKVTLYGGRSQQLPYCGQRNFQNETGLRQFGIKTNDNSWLEIDGQSWSGLTVHGFERSGIRIDRNSKNITVRNVEVYNNGYVKSTSNGWVSDGVGLRLGGENVLLERAIIHDNGQDAIQSLWDKNNIRNFQMKYTWLHNSRRHPSVDESFNYCTHTDGIQIYDGGVVSDITIENSIVGPGFTQGLMLGQTRTSNGQWADVQNVVIRDTVVTKSADNGIYGYRNSNSRNWTLERVTLDCAATKWQCIYLHNRDHSVRDSIIYSGRVTFEDGLNQFYNNCVWQNKDFVLGPTADPMFASISPSNRFSQDNYTVSSSSGCAGKGSRMTSVQQLLNTGRGPTGPAATPTPTATPVPSGGRATPTPTPTSPPSQGSTPGQCSGLVQEAEAGQLQGLFAIGSDGAASGGRYIHVPEGKGNRGSRLDDAQKVSYCFNVPSAGNYRIKGWVYASNQYNNSFYLKIDGAPGAGHVWHTKTNVGYGTEYATTGNGISQVQIYLSAGKHTVELFLREDGTRLDKLALEAIGSGQSMNALDEEESQTTQVNHTMAQWVSGTVRAAEQVKGVQQDGSTLLAKGGLALVDAETNGDSIYLDINVNAEGSYYVDTAPVGRYKLRLPLGYAFIGNAPEVEIGSDEVKEQNFEFIYQSQQLFLPLIQ